MDEMNKSKFDEVIEEFKSRIEQMGYDHDGESCVKPSEMFSKSKYNEMFLAVTAKRPMIVCGEVSDMLRDLREKLGDEVSKRIEVIFNLLGSDIDKQEENFKKMPFHIRWAFKGFMYLSACLEWVVFGCEKLYKKVRAWIESMNGKIGFDVFNLPEKMPTIDEALDYLNEKLDLEKQFHGLFNPV